MLTRLLLFLAQAALIVFVTLVLAGAFAARQRPDLQSWHTVELPSEFRAGQGVDTLEEFLDLEERVFRELEERVVVGVRLAEPDNLNRYARTSRSYPERDGRNWNRSQVSDTDSPRGGILLLHGMTDSPYSMRHFAALFREKGWNVLNLRVPGHGTAPSELARVDWRDWEAAVRVGAASVAERLAPNQPFYIMGYSNGGSLAVNYALASLGDPGLRIPDRLILLSPMIGVSGLASLGKIYYWMGKLGFFEKASWLDLLPEYDPHKYNSFPMNGPRQSAALTRTIDRRVQQAVASGAIEAMPPVLTFQSLVDSTVSSRAVVTRLYDRLPANGSELVLFDVNRSGVLESFVAPQHDALLAELDGPAPKNYGYTLISNRGMVDGRLVARSIPARGSKPSEQALPYRWPEDQYSLSHVALPFPPDDEVYGSRAPARVNGFPRLGRAQLKGESGALVLPANLSTRARSNPFHGYVEDRILEILDRE
ncbi:MAG: alpha/beta hydrolase [Xanthomonadales bacterium]|nr:alpha/beta hydrolase [Xanthomonadales bacterium]